MSGTLILLSGGGKSPISLSVNSEYHVGNRTGAGSVTTYGPAIVTASGGVGALSYSWAKVSGDTISANSASSASTIFTGTVTLNGVLAAVFRCTVSDSFGNSNTIDVNVSLFEVSYS